MFCAAAEIAIATNGAVITKNRGFAWLPFLGFGALGWKLPVLPRLGENSDEQFDGRVKGAPALSVMRGGQ